MTNSQGHTPLGEIWNSIQSWLFPVLEDEIGELDEKLAGHVSRDATAIHAREKAAAKTPPVREPKKKRGRRRKDEPPALHPDPTRLQRQLGRDLRDNLADLPAACDWGCKKNSQSKKESWHSYKPHVDTIDDNPGRGEKREFSPSEAVRYHERSAAERVNSHLHDEHGGRYVRVRGPQSRWQPTSLRADGHCRRADAQDARIVPVRFKKAHRKFRSQTGDRRSVPEINGFQIQNRRR